MEGPLTPDGLSPLKIILGWLGGNQKMVAQLRPQDELKTGPPVLVTAPERAGEFKRQLRTRLTRGLDIIHYDHDEPPDVQEENDRLNQLMNRYRASQFAPFETGGRLAFGLGG